MTIIKAVDLFCGAGGTSTGLYHACESLGLGINLLAVNHWATAIETHRINHPSARHLCATLETIDPRQEIKSRHLDILVASPECTHHSVARGGKPVNDQLRASAWHILRWVELLKIDNILIENVKEFRDWGPTDKNGKPLKRRKGETYQAFLAALRSLNYTVEDRLLNAADYGDPTSRTRLFVIARRGNKKITWPDPSHTDNATVGLFEKLPPYRTAREVIDWNLPGKSIFKRKKQLAPGTMARIAAGLRKYGGKNAEPFLVMLYGTNDARSVDRPMPTITANGQHIGLCRPFLIHTNHVGGDRVHDINRPIPTITCGHRGEMALVEPFVLGQQSCAAPRSVDEPLPTICTAGAISLIEPFITKYYGRSKTASINEPLDTITTKDRFGLVEPCSDGDLIYDIRFRMLQPHELAAAMSFDKNYQFAGNKTEQVKQIGNAVPVRTAAALCKSLLSEKYAA